MHLVVEKVVDVLEFDLLVGLVDFLVFLVFPLVDFAVLVEGFMIGFVGGVGAFTSAQFATLLPVFGHLLGLLMKLFRRVLDGILLEFSLLLADLAGPGFRGGLPDRDFLGGCIGLARGGLLRLFSASEAAQAFFDLARPEGHHHTVGPLAGLIRTIGNGF
ncbi:MAG: hypothetical protein AB7J86_41845 [Vulcanimicrobiota bacterium]